MLRDGSLSFEELQVNDKVYVYFPVKRVGCSSKLTSYWRGPYQITEKLSNSLYKVNCGREGMVQVIHCDRLRKAKQQLLTGETDQVEVSIGEEEATIDINNDKEYEVDFRQSRRIKRKPDWLKDYVEHVQHDEKSGTSVIHEPLEQKISGEIRSGKEDREAGDTNTCIQPLECKPTKEISTMTDMEEKDNIKRAVASASEDEDIDEVQITLRPTSRKRLRLRIPGVGSIKIDLKMELLDN